MSPLVYDCFAVRRVFDEFLHSEMSICKLRLQFPLSTAATYTTRIFPRFVDRLGMASKRQQLALRNVIAVVKVDSSRSQQFTYVFEELEGSPRRLASDIPSLTTSASMTNSPPSFPAGRRNSV